MNVELAGNLEELQKVSDYRSVRKTLRPAGIGSIIFGILALVMGVILLEDNPLNIVLALIGLFLLIEGIWLTASPTPTGMILDGIALMVLGAWNVLVTIANAAAGSGSTSTVAVLGIFQIWWGIQSFKRYGRFKNVSTDKLPEESVRYVDDLVKGIAKSKAAKEPDIIQFQISSGQPPVWKGRLLADAALCVSANGQEAVIARKNDVSITAEGKVLLGKNLKASFQFGDRIFKGSIAPEFFDRYQAWKTGVVAGGTMQPELPKPIE
jgi:hypothetical protein